MNDESEIGKLKRLCGHWPITVERYDSGQVGFVARPQIKSKRYNRSFSTSRYGEPQKAVEAAINFCKTIIGGTDYEVKQLLEGRAERRRIAKIPKDLIVVIRMAQDLGLDVEAVLIRAIQEKASRRS